MAELRTFYVTKHALTTGIKAIQGLLVCTRENWVKEPEDPRYLMRNFRMWSMLTDCHNTLEEAIARAELMREREIHSLKRRIEKLEAMDFTAQTAALRLDS